MSVARPGTPTTVTGTTFPTVAFAGWNYTAETGSNRCVYLFVGNGKSSGAGAATGVTLGGQAMTEVQTRVTDSNWVSIQVYRLLEAGIAAMSGVAGSVANITGFDQVGLVAFTLTDVDQTTPETSPQSGSGSGTTAQASASVNSTSSGLVIGAIMSDSESGITESNTLIVKTAVMNSDTICAGQQATGTGSAINLSWSQANTGWAVRNFNVQSASAGAAFMPSQVPNPGQAVNRSYFW